jgi:hypothetical protein
MHINEDSYNTTQKLCKITSHLPTLILGLKHTYVQSVQIIASQQRLFEPQK